MGHQEKEELQDKYLRLLAEFDNFKKRMQKEQEQFLRFSNELVLMQLLPIVDDFDRAHEAAKEHKHGEVFSKGVEMILNQLHKLLKDNGIEKIKTVGEKFNPQQHEAIEAAEDKTAEDGTIIEELQSGYTLGGQIIRPAKVKVAKNKEE